MSRVIENHCVDCGLPCIGNACMYYNVQVYYCDECNDNVAKYRIDDEDLCEDCASQIIKNAFGDLTLSDQAKLTEIDLHEIDD